MIWLPSGSYQCKEWKLKGSDDTMFIKTKNHPCPSRECEILFTPAVFLLVLCLHGGRWRTRLDGSFFPLHEFG